ncbi:hypothetical protein LSCM1_00211 [Leishmania martiniquensis]|uniref:dolichyl-P-Man:Man5GlcNAc2-PP-dolichol alpha-1,3-mannosyltransferase n=1 Tax=Leishmania martiniquensis TaxID=1580590 RepID=A0A836K8K4_9TRYP|nr:hypothetical protein LSCM1_00211 [Leishmania martiniquensis]
MRFMDVALVVETAVIVAVIATVPYTEVDWRAYMEEVKGFLDGELNYHNLRGSTGSLVYPGGFVWLYSAIYCLTKKGEAILFAQWIYAGVYLVTLAMVLRLYTRAGLTWRAMIPLFVSKRIRSLYVLRLFNDCWAMLFLFAAVSFIAGRPSDPAKRSHQWLVGCLCYSIAVSIKMNVLLFAPGMLYVMLRTLPLRRVVCYLLLCAAWQVAVGLPFLAYNCKAYLSKSFDLHRVFTHRWSVNYQFLDAEVFGKPALGQALLVMTLATWVLLWRTRWASRTYLTDEEAYVLHPVIADTRRQSTFARCSTTEDEQKAQRHAVYTSVLLTFFEANLVGIAFARSIHYQFYTWFFYTVPFVLAHTMFPRLLQLLSFALIRQAFEVYPPTATTSLMLQGGFALMLLAFLFLGHDGLEAALPRNTRRARRTEPKPGQAQVVGGASGEQ